MELSKRLFKVPAAVMAMAVIAMASAQGFDYQELGQTVFQQSCSGCHGGGGAGVPGLFPPLAGHVPDMMNAEGGRELVAKVVLFGMAGPIDVDGTPYDGTMPAWKHLSDEQVAAVIDFMATAWGNDAALTAELLSPAEVAELRALDLTPQQVHAERTGQDPADAAEYVPPLNDDTGYYTAEQAQRGEALYAEHCAACHGANMRGGLHGPALTNIGYFRKWGDRTIDTFFDMFSTQMPVQAPGSLWTHEYVDILAFWMSKHGYPAGDTELTADRDVLRGIVIERR